MYAPHVITLYNSVTETDPKTFEESTTLYATKLAGVFLDASKAVNVRQSGLESADAVDLYIPLGVTALDATSGAVKRYADPQEFSRAEDKNGLWTLSVKGNGVTTFFIKGDFVADNEFTALAHPDCYALTKVDLKDFGSADMRHWQCGGA